MIEIIKMNSVHYPTVSRIYKEGIETKNATFETEPPKWEDFSAKFLDFSKSVAILNDEVVGWAALSSVSSRCVYAGVCEVSVYTSPSVWGKGIGKQLLDHLIQLSEANGIWMLQAGIFPENEASVKIHISQGFRIVGRRERIGKMNNKWRDTLLLERRSTQSQFS